MSGLSRTPGKRVWVNSPPRVRIPPSPPIFVEKAPVMALFCFSALFPKVFEFSVEVGFSRVFTFVSNLGFDSDRV